MATDLDLGLLRTLMFGLISPLKCKFKKKYRKFEKNSSSKKPELLHRTVTLPRKEITMALIVSGDVES